MDEKDVLASTSFSLEELVAIGRCVEAAGLSPGAVEGLLGSVAQSGHGVAVLEGVHPSYPVRWVNNGFSEITGYSSEEVVGRPADSVVSLSKQKRLRALAAVRAGVSESVVVDAFTKHGRPYSGLFTFSPRYDGGSLDSITTVLRDVTREERERKRTVRRQDLQAGGFHNLKNDITGVSGNIEIACMQWEEYRSNPSEPNAEELSLRLDGLRLSAKHLRSRSKTLFDHLLGSRSLDSQVRPYDLGDLATEALNPLYAVAKSRGVRVNFFPAPVIGWVEREEYMGAVENLAGNALKFADSRVDVFFDAVVRGGSTYAALRVVDDGPGVAAEYEEKIFSPGNTVVRQQGVDDSLVEQSTGFGLYITREYAREIGGFVELENPGLAGASFVLGVRAYEP